jgi:hypothetical protein
MHYPNQAPFSHMEKGLFCAFQIPEKYILRLTVFVKIEFYHHWQDSSLSPRQERQGKGELLPLQRDARSYSGGRSGGRPGKG